MIKRQLPNVISGITFIYFIAYVILGNIEKYKEAVNFFDYFALIGTSIVPTIGVIFSCIILKILLDILFSNF